MLSLRAVLSLRLGEAPAELTMSLALISSRTMGWPGGGIAQ
jgi:hypothetical protein